ncbi:MAG: phosphatidylserine decarboxylase [Sphingobacteriales bacterium]|jgi:phosphatidylserine decarboxylase
MTIHREGHVPIMIALILALVFNCIGWAWFPQVMGVKMGVAIFTIVVFCLLVWFFRSPTRKISRGENNVISPCDGKVVIIEEVDEPEFLKEKVIQISIFMSPLNVHIQWHALSGIIEYFKYHPGKYLVAWHPKSSTMNERTTTVYKHKSGARVLVRQVAGALARRIRWYVEKDQNVAQGNELGFIKFGSRVDVYLPIGTKINVKIGDKVSGLETVLADL